MNNYKLAILLFSLLLCSQFSFALEGEEQLYAELLTHKNSAHIKAASQSIYNKGINNIELVDIVAEVLARSLKGDVALKEDDQAWLAKTLGSTRNQRYKSVLSSVINSDVSRKVKKYARKSLSNLSQPSEELFSPGKVDLEAIAQAIKSKKLAYKSPATDEKLNSIHVGDTLEHVLNRLGMPSRVSVVYAKRKQAWVGWVSYSMLSFEYNEIGALKFEYFSEPVENWSVSKIARHVNVAQYPADFSNHPMLHERYSMVRAYIKEIMKDVSATDLDRDLAAERLYKDVNRESYVDTLSWACKLLGVSGNARYRAVLENTIARADSRKLRKYAEKALSQISLGDEKQYLPGDVFKNKGEAPAASGSE